MKRWAFRICALLLLGAIVNVAVAWTIDLYLWNLEETVREAAASESDVAWWLANMPGEFKQGSAATDVHERRMFGSTLLILSNDEIVCFRDRKGWPLRSLEGQRRLTPHYDVVIEAWMLPMSALGLAGKRYLNLHPLWPGFAINTVFYAAILWLLSAAPFALRRRLRSKRGLCPACGYDLRRSDSATCPECGNALAKRESPRNVRES